MIYRMRTFTHIKAIKTRTISDPEWAYFREAYPNYTWADVVEYFDIDE